MRCAEMVLGRSFCFSIVLLILILQEEGIVILREGKVAEEMGHGAQGRGVVAKRKRKKRGQLWVTLKEFFKSKIFEKTVHTTALRIFAIFGGSCHPHLKFKNLVTGRGDFCVVSV